MRLRYTGKIPTTLMAQGRELQPDEEFDVLDEEAESFIARDDVEQAQEPKAKKTRQPVRALTIPDTLQELPQPEAKSEVPDDH